MRHGKHDVLGRGLRDRAAEHALPHGHTADAATDFVDDAGEVTTEPGWQSDPEPCSDLGEQGDASVHRVQPHCGHADADLAGTGVRLGDLAHLQHVGAAERLMDHSTTHRRPPGVMGLCAVTIPHHDGTWCRKLLTCPAGSRMRHNGSWSPPSTCSRRRATRTRP